MKRTKKVKANPVREGFVVRDVWTLPRTAEAYDAMVAQVEKHLPLSWVIKRAVAIIALRAIGITRPKEEQQ